LGSVFGIGMTELLVILVIGLLVLGPKRLPELARSLGRGLAEFRRASTEMRKEFMDVAEEVRNEPLPPDAPEKKADAPAAPRALASSADSGEPDPAHEREEAAPASGAPQNPPEKISENPGE
jgi:Tat protein translocase TatB subunit